MALNAKDKQTIARFWSERADRKSGRWTTGEMFEFEEEVTEKLLSDCSSLLDLGSGTGLFSKKWVSKNSERRATCVDFETKFAQSYVDDGRVNFVCSSAFKYRSSQVFDCAIAFGLVTHLDATEELLLYQNLSDLIRPGGVAIVKNSVSTAETEKVFRGYSIQLGADYVGRYPSANEQLERLLLHFSEVETVPYPKKFKRFEGTEDLMFVCRK